MQVFQVFRIVLILQQFQEFLIFHSKIKVTLLF